MPNEYASPIDRISVVLNAFRYRSRLIVLVALAILAIAGTYILQMPNVYKAETQILVNPQRISDKYVSSVVSMDASERLNTLSQQILSSSRLELIMDEFQLFPKLRGRVSREELVGRMRKNIGIELKQNSDGLSAFTLVYTANSPTEVAAVANRLADSFIAWNLQDRQQQAQGTTNFLENELSTTKSQLDGLEEQLRVYKMQHLGELPDQMQANLQTLSRLQVELQANSEAQSRLDHEALFDNTAAQNPDAGRAATISPRQHLLAEKATMQASLADLRTHYTESFPDVTQKRQEIQDLDRQIAALPADNPAPSSAADPAAPATTHAQLIKRDRARLAAEHNTIEASVRRYQGRIDTTPVREQEVSQLLRDYDTARDHYRSLLEKTYSAQMAVQLEQQQQGGSFTMLDRARVPDAPVGPKRIPLLAGVFFLALIGGIGSALIAEFMDGTVKSEAELREYLPGIPMLGTTPDMKRQPVIQRALTSTRLLIGGN